MQVETLDTPLLLVAMPQVADGFFNRSVVLLLEHSENGSFGLVINRPLDITVPSVVADLDIHWHGDEEAVVYFGGPVQPTAGITLFQTDEWIDGEIRAAEVAPGVQLANDRETLKTLALSPPQRFRLLVGYSGWGEGQLENELARNDWLLAPFDADLVFADDAEEVWSRALKSIGVRPESLPSWTHRDDGEREN